MIRGLREFVRESGGFVPLAGSLPDMHSSTESYTKLHVAFHQKSSQDLHRFSQLVQEEVKRSEADPIPQSTINMFAKHCNNIAVLKSIPLERELESGPVGISQLLEDLDHPIHFYMSLIASNEFTDQFKRSAGINPNDCDDDFSQLKKITHGILDRWCVSGSPSSASSALSLGSSPRSSVRDDILLQFVKYGLSELHPMCALMGGMGAQEVIKILTNQYVPITGSLLYVGLNSPSVTSIQ